MSVIIPALDEEGAIGRVVSDLAAVLDDQGAPLVEEIVVADNGSADRTGDVAKAAGATVVVEARRGYGSACLAGMAHLAARTSGPPDVVVFADGDGSNVAADLPKLIAPIVRGEADLVIVNRTTLAAPGSLTFTQRFGNWLATAMMFGLYRVHYRDLGPFRAVRWSALERMGMIDPNYGWTVEMQVKAAKQQIPVAEVDVQNRSRIAGRSKVTGTVRGVVGAGYKIIWTILKYR